MIMNLRRPSSKLTICGDDMNSFLDSNVIIGYIFQLDSSFDKSKELIFYSDSNFCSENVINEVNGVFKRKSSEFTEFFIKLDREISEFEDNPLVSCGEIHESITKFNDIGKLKVKDMHIAFEKLWNLFKFSENQELHIIKLMFDKFFRNYNDLNYSRKCYIFNELKLVPNHSKKDKKILDIIKKENLKDRLLHDSDEDILFDANELAENNKELDLEFVTADQNFYKAINILMDYLSFDKCINLMEFSNS